VETNGLLKSDPTRAKKYLEKAADIYNEAIRLAGNEEATARIYMRIAECYCAVQRFDDALNCYKEIIIKWPDSKAEAECLKGIGKYYEELEKQGQINQIQFESELEQLCKELIGKYPESPQTAEMLIKLGWTKFRHGKLDGSIQWFEEGLAKSPACCKPPDALYIVGRYYQQNGKYEKAIVAYQELLKILPAGSPQIEIVNQKLQQINEISQ
jgi:tetratricopeptide (TPR) repeat protein